VRLLFKKKKHSFCFWLCLVISLIVYNGLLYILVLDCRDMIENALILMGEIGGNDYNYAFFVDKGIEEIKELMPLVITTISSAITVNIYLS